MQISDVHNIDCMELMRSTADKFFDLAVVDPPYGLPKTSTHDRGQLKSRILNRDDIIGGTLRLDLNISKNYSG